jgi:hypothetical protein
MKKVRSKSERVTKEKGFDTNTANASLPEYNALRDSNLRQHFESPNVIKYLHRIGFVDHTGHIVDIDKHKSKVAIIEQEFKYAEKAEALRLREEEAARRMVQMRRHHALKEAQKHEKVRRLKEENKIRQELIKANKTNKAVIELEGSLRREWGASRDHSKTRRRGVISVQKTDEFAPPDDEFEDFEEEHELFDQSEPPFDRPKADSTKTHKEVAENVPSGAALMKDAERGAFDDEWEDLTDVDKTAEFDREQRFNREQGSLRKDNVFLTQQDA